MNAPIVKIWSIILILGITLGALVYWGIGNFKESSGAIQQIVQPDVRTDLTNDIFKSVIQSDLHLNNFILTNDSIQLRLSKKFANQSDSLISVLQLFTEKGDYQYERIDSLKKIISEKTRVNAVLTELKKKQNSLFFTEKALNRIKGQLSDSAYIDKAITRKEDLIAKVDTIERIDIVKSTAGYKGISGFFRKVFGKERIQIDTLSSLEEQINYSLEVSVDSSIVRNYFVDTTIMAVKSILIDVLDEEIKLQKRLYATELDIIKYNELLLENTSSLLYDISLSNKDSLNASQESAIGDIESALRKAFTIAGVGIVLGLILLLILINDITKTNLYRRKLEEEKERAEQLALAKEVFLSKMSHEIRTPIHSISGFANLLEKEVLSTKQAKLVSGISYSNQYLNELIDNILEQARINFGNFKLEKTEVYIPTLCKEIEELFRLRQEEQQNKFVIDYSDNLVNLTVKIDRVKLKQVFVNLLGNAFKFTKDGRVTLKVLLTERQNDYMLHIEVADTGAGIDPARHASIFDPFNQPTVGHSANINGTGLGLSISKYIVESFGGSIAIRSEVGIGSTFIIDLPVACGAYEEVEKTKLTEQSSKVYYDISVLAVEDDKWNAYLLEKFLSQHVAALTIHENAEDALQAFEGGLGNVDLILTDLNLPGMSGRAFFQAIATSSHLVHVFALSASLAKSDIAELTKDGFAEAIGKPFSQTDLLMAIDRHFQRTDSHINIESKEGNENNSIDLGRLEAFSMGDITLLMEQQAFFIGHFSSQVEELRASLEAGNASELARVAHQLKSNCEQIGVTALSESLHTIEVCAGIGKDANAMQEAKSILPLLVEVRRQLSINHASIL